MSEKNPGETDEIVMVPVPRRLLGAVYGVLGAAMAEPTRGTDLDYEFPPDEAQPVRDPGPKPQDQAVLVDRRNGWWTPEMIRLLHARLSHPGARAIIDALAERAPREVALAEISEATGISVPQLRAELGAMTKLCKKLFGGRKTWPFSVRWALGGVANYSMNETIAGWWRDQ